MALLLTESLDAANRERTHEHIENCAVCNDEWLSMRETWAMLGDLPTVDVPRGVKQRFLAEIQPALETTADEQLANNVVPFHRRPSFKWLTQAAAVAVIAGGAYFAGHRTTQVTIGATPATMNGVASPDFTRVALPTTPSYSIAESRVFDAAAISPNIEGRPDIENVQFVDDNPGDDEIGVSFDLTSHVTVKGHPNDKSMVRLLSYVLENEDRMSPSRSRAIDWVRTTYSNPANANPEIANALAKVMRYDEHQGVRIKAAETLKTLPGAVTDNTRDALIEALRSDPNPAVRIKAVEALANLARSGVTLDETTIDMLRQKASQGDENMYVRVKAAEALSNIRPQ